MSKQHHPWAQVHSQEEESGAGTLSGNTTQLTQSTASVGEASELEKPEGSPFTSKCASWLSLELRDEGGLTNLFPFPPLNIVLP